MSALICDPRFSLVWHVAKHPPHLRDVIWQPKGCDCSCNSYTTTQHFPKTLTTSGNPRPPAQRTLRYIHPSSHSHTALTLSLPPIVSAANRKLLLVTGHLILECSRFRRIITSLASSTSYTLDNWVCSNGSLLLRITWWSWILINPLRFSKIVLLDLIYKEYHITTENTPSQQTCALNAANFQCTIHVLIPHEEAAYRSS